LNKAYGFKNVLYMGFNNEFVSILIIDQSTDFLHHLVKIESTNKVDKVLR